MHIYSCTSSSNLTSIVLGWCRLSSKVDHHHGSADAAIIASCRLNSLPDHSSQYWDGDGAASVRGRFSGCSSAICSAYLAMSAAALLCLSCAARCLAVHETAHDSDRQRVRSRDWVNGLRRGLKFTGRSRRRAGATTHQNLVQKDPGTPENEAHA